MALLRPKAWSAGADVKAIIAGAGIGGLTAALELQARGIRVQLFESTPQITPLGAGINLLPHSVRALDGLGLMQRLLAGGVATRELVYFNRFGQRIWGEARGRYAGYDWPQISLHRGTLQAVLLEAVRERLGDDAVQFGRKLAGFEAAGSEAIAWFADGTQARAGVLIAADGLHSAARKQLYPQEGAPIYSGRILWRGVTRAKPFLTGASMIMAGNQDQKFVCYPIGEPDADGLQPLNWIAELRRDVLRNREDYNRAGVLEDFLPAFESWDFGWLDVGELIRRAQRVFEYPLVDRDPLARWSSGRMTLLGDAAHPMYPIGSNGASQAILDARMLGETLGASGPVEEALRAYEAGRLGPTAAIVRANRGNGPEQCMQIVHERAPDGFARIEEVISTAELEGIAARYKEVAGFTKDALVRQAASI
jgi:5-methylphenazine-1-carboxylate 1-monooxygenase